MNNSSSNINVEQSLDVSSGAPCDTPKDNDMESSSSCGECRTTSEIVEFNLSFGVISLLVIAGIHWNECAIIPSLNIYLVTFASTVLTNALVKFMFRTEKLKLQGGPMWPWVYIESFLELLLLGLSIWGATLVFGNLDKRGDDGDCSSEMLIAALVSVIITWVIFLGVTIYIVYLIVKESKKQQERVMPPSGDDNDDEQP